MIEEGYQADNVLAGWLEYNRYVGILYGMAKEVRTGGRIDVPGAIPEIDKTDNPSW